MSQAPTNRILLCLQASAILWGVAACIILFGQHLEDGTNKLGQPRTEIEIFIGWTLVWIGSFYFLPGYICCWSAQFLLQHVLGHPGFELDWVFSQVLITFPSIVAWWVIAYFFGDG